jgi:hypothetical protein
MNPPDDFDSWLDAELDKGFARSGVRSQAGIGHYKNVVSRHRRFHLMSPAGIPLAGKAAVGLAAATLSLGAVSAAAATAVTHSTNPQAWGQQVKEAVAACKEARTPSQNGIGECVSAFAKQHGAAKRTEHAQDKQSDQPNEVNAPNEARGHKPPHPVVSPSPGFEGQSDTSHGQGGQHASPNPHRSGGEGNSDSHPTPSSH